MAEIGEFFNGLGLMFLIGVIVMVIVVIAMTVDFVSGWRKLDNKRGRSKRSGEDTRQEGMTDILLQA